MPDELAFTVNYFPNVVQLEVVPKLSFFADFDDDGDVDMTDREIWVHARNLNQLGDATGDSISDAADWVVWRKEFGSHSGMGGSPEPDGQSATVPEPGMWACLASLALGLTLRRRLRDAERGLRGRNVTRRA
jgi:hypothetical protein